MLGLAVLIVVGLAVPTGGSVRSAVDGPSLSGANGKVYTVHPGDTLWSIAVAQDPEGNVLPLLDRLETETHDRPLQVGEQIVVP